jgi:hypothetical protein
MSRSPARSDLPPSPPPEVLVEVAAAWERARVLVAGFTLDLRCVRWWRRVRGELRGPEASVVRCLTAGEVLAIACGDAPV